MIANLKITPSWRTQACFEWPSKWPDNKHKLQSSHLDASSGAMRWKKIVKRRKSRGVLRMEIANCRKRIVNANANIDLTEPRLFLTSTFKQISEMNF